MQNPWFLIFPFFSIVPFFAFHPKIWKYTLLLPSKKNIYFSKILWAKNEEDWDKDEFNRQSLLDVLGDGLGSFRDGVSGKFSGEDELDGRLDFAGRKSSSLVESDELGSFGGDSVEGVVDEGVHDVHGLLGDTDVGVHLLEDLVDVDGEGFNSSSSGFLVSFRSGGFSLSHLYSLNNCKFSHHSKFNMFIIPSTNIPNYDWLHFPTLCFLFIILFLPRTFSLELSPQSATFSIEISPILYFITMIFDQDHKINTHQPKDIRDEKNSIFLSF